MLLLSLASINVSYYVVKLCALSLVRSCSPPSSLQLSFFLMVRQLMFRCYVICPMTSTVNLKKRIRVIAKIALANQLSGIRLVSSALASFKVLLGRRRSHAWRGLSHPWGWHTHPLGRSHARRCHHTRGWASHAWRSHTWGHAHTRGWNHTWRRGSHHTHAGCTDTSSWSSEPSGSLLAHRRDLYCTSHRLSFAWPSV